MGQSDAEIRARIASYDAWYHRIEIRPGITTPGSNDGGVLLEFLALPEDCRGMRVLDLGTRDGMYAFEMERRGAEVIAIDYMPSMETGFDIAADLLGSRVEYIQDNLYNVSVERYGTFDVVLCLGLLYHMRYPLLALDLLRKVCTGVLYLETQIVDQALLLSDGSFCPLDHFGSALITVPLMQFYPLNTLNDDVSNYWAPNLACLTAMLAEANFTTERREVWGNRALLCCKAANNPHLDYLRRIADGTTLWSRDEAMDAQRRSMLWERTRGQSNGER